ncbi:response regulator transcription factor [Leucobacter coleopterorum]|uniref:response regulator transcription factor n=1 Tax=Leucobacter coleopterorum TaxID=2714933 RepID=UPI001FCC627F|nr:response regulator transcription factor [Leucobacter coleopterorum]
MTETARVLVVEDDPRLLSMLVDLLRSEGYEVVSARDGQRGLHEGLTQRFDVLLLDRGLPAIEGLDVLTKLRSRGVLTPALILSALANPADRVEGLDRGAEDYLSKPFDIDELLARIRALQRRVLSSTPVLSIPGGSLDTQSRAISQKEGSVIHLSERECDLLELFARHPSQVFSRADLLRGVFPEAEDLGIIDTYVHYLRKKNGRNTVETVRGIGYRLGRMPS